MIQLKDSSVVGIIIDIRKAQKNYEYDVLNTENNLIKSVTAARITRTLNDSKVQTFKKGDQVSLTKMDNKQVRTNIILIIDRVWVKVYVKKEVVGRK